MNEQQRQDILQGEMTDLFELNRGSEWYDQCMEYSYLSGRGSTWKSLPGTYRFMNDKGEWKEYKKPAKEGYEKYMRWLGKQDRFSIAVSPRKFDDTRCITGEWDLNDFPTIPDEHALKYLLNDGLNRCASEYFTIHWRFSGHRSIYFDIFTSARIKKKTAIRLVNCLKHMIDTKSFGEHNLQQCMRLPFSRHYETNQLCRYEGTHTPDGLAEYIKFIERDIIDDRQVNQACRRLESYLGIKRNHRGIEKDHSDEQWSSDYDKVLGIGCKITLQDEWIQRLGTSTFLADHPRRDEYIHYMTHGIPVHHFNDVMFAPNGDFQKFVMIAIGVKETAYGYLQQLACIDVPEFGRRKDRLKRIDYIFNKYWQDWQDCDCSYVPTQQINAYDWAEEFMKRIKQEAYLTFGDQRVVNNLAQVMQYCLRLLYHHPEGATIAVCDVQKKLGISRPSVVKYLKLLKKEFPILRIKNPHSRSKHLATDYIMNWEYVASVFGYKPEEQLAA